MLISSRTKNFFAKFKENRYTSLNKLLKRILWNRIGAYFVASVSMMAISIAHFPKLFLIYSKRKYLNLTRVNKLTPAAVVVQD